MNENKIAKNYYFSIVFVTLCKGIKFYYNSKTLLFQGF